MLIVHVHVQVKPEAVDAFKNATRDNVRQSILESGIARFELHQQTDDPTRFILVEIYRSEEAVTAHKETQHYQQWREVVAPMMAQPRQSTKLQNVFPPDAAF